MGFYEEEVTKALKGINKVRKEDNI